MNDVVEGFELGGNDYLKKPFAIQELIVRIKSLCHRASVGNISSEEQEGGMFLLIIRMLLINGSPSVVIA